MILQTERANLTLLQASDYDAVLALFLEPDMFKYITPGQDKTIAQHIAFLDLKQQEIASKKGFYWIARTKVSKELIGCINLTPITGTQKIQIGWFVSTKFRKQGLAYETAKAVLDFAIQQTSFKPIYAVYEADNIASNKIMEKLNFQFLKTTLEEGIEIHTYIFDINH